MYLNMQGAVACTVLQMVQMYGVCINIYLTYKQRRTRSPSLSQPYVAVWMSLTT